LNPTRIFRERKIKKVTNASLFIIDFIIKLSYNLNCIKLVLTSQVFGLDFMLDQSLKVWLIESNTNPAITICSPLLSRIIPQMLENVLKMTVDTIFPPP